AVLFLEGHRRDGPILATFFIGPDDARIRCHFEVATEELHTSAEYEAVLASGTNIHLAGDQGHVHRLWHPPALHQLGLGPRLEHDARRSVERPRDEDFTIGLPFDSRDVLHG